MAVTYAAFVADVRAWTNRDSDVLSDTIIGDAMSYAADKAYKALQIKELEYTQDYTVIAEGDTPANVYEIIPEDHGNGAKMLTLPLPDDFTYFISIRFKTANEGKKGVVFNEKADVRTFYDAYADHYTDFYWTRKADNLLVTGTFAEGDVIELFYYRKLSDLTDDGTANWLRDENRRVLLFGAVHECMDYLDDDAAAAKYKQKFMEAIAELNEEEKRRKVSGGNTQVHFNSQLL